MVWNKRTVCALVTMVLAGMMGLYTGNAAAQSWSVAYFETGHEVSDQAVNALAAYVALTRGVEGNLGSIALRQQDRTNQFVILEEWRDDMVREVHATGSIAVDLRTLLEPILVSGYDERIYGPMEVDGGLVNDNAAVYVVTHIDVASRPRETGIELVRDMALRSRDDEGSLRIMALSWAVRNNHMTVIEAWATDQARQAHIATDHMKAFRLALTPVSGSMYDERVYNVILAAK